jgi:hypothetical protein
MAALVLFHAKEEGSLNFFKARLKLLMLPAFCTHLSSLQLDKEASISVDDQI